MDSLLAVTLNPMPAIRGNKSASLGLFYGEVLAKASNKNNRNIRFGYLIYRFTSYKEQGHTGLIFNAVTQKKAASDTIDRLPSKF